MTRLLFISLFLIYANIGFCKREEFYAIATCKAKDFFSHPTTSDYQQELNKYFKENNLPGAILAFKRGTESVWVGAIGKANLDAGIPMQSHTKFRIGSITKVFIGVTILKLAEEKRLTLEDPLTQWLPEVKGGIPEAQKITIRMLLNHTSGIFDPKNDDSTYIKKIEKEPDYIGNMDIKNRLKNYVYKKALLFSPGTEYHYSNSGYWLLGMIIDQITKKKLQLVLEEAIFLPAKMSNTYYEKRKDTEVAHGYFNIDGSLTDVTIYDRADGDGDPSSGIISTAEDLIKFGNALFYGKLISKASLEQMKVTSKLQGCDNGDCENGLGIERWKTKSSTGYGHNGSSIGYDVNWIYFPDKDINIVSFANKGGGTVKNFIENVLN